MYLILIEIGPKLMQQSVIDPNNESKRLWVN